MMAQCLVHPRVPSLWVYQLHVVLRGVSAASGALCYLRPPRELTWKLGKTLRSTIWSGGHRRRLQASVALDASVAMLASLAALGLAFLLDRRLDQGAVVRFIDAVTQPVVLRTTRTGQGTLAAYARRSLAMWVDPCATRTWFSSKMGVTRFEGQQSVHWLERRAQPGWPSPGSTLDKLRGR